MILLHTVGESELQSLYPMYCDCCQLLYQESIVRCQVIYAKGPQGSSAIQPGAHRSELTVDLSWWGPQNEPTQRVPANGQPTDSATRTTLTSNTTLGGLTEYTSMARKPQQEQTTLI